MARQLTGEFSPPRELVAIAVPRVAGRGAIGVSADGLVVDGTVFGSAWTVSPWAAFAVVVVGLAISSLVPHAERVLTPATTILALGLIWLRYRADFGRTATFRLGWTDVEHVVRLPADPSVVAFVLARPLSGWGSPEQLFFAPTGGVDGLVDALRSEAPASLSIEIGELAVDDGPGEDDPDDAPLAG
ncbi:MAG: hypothetical protein ABMB14_19835 [Myxococcota bacterium]